MVRAVLGIRHCTVTDIWPYTICQERDKQHQCPHSPKSLDSALYVISLYMGIQILESNLITPAIQQETVSLPPALTITSQLLMAILTGGLGLALATPLTAALIVLIRMLYIEDVLNDYAKLNNTGIQSLKR